MKFEFKVYKNEQHIETFTKTPLDAITYIAKQQPTLTLLNLIKYTSTFPLTIEDDGYYTTEVTRI